MAVLCTLLGHKWGWGRVVAAASYGVAFTVPEEFEVDADVIRCKRCATWQPMPRPPESDAQSEAGSRSGAVARSEQSDETGSPGHDT